MRCEQAPTTSACVRPLCGHPRVCDTLSHPLLLLRVILVVSGREVSFKAMDSRRIRAAAFALARHEMLQRLLSVILEGCAVQPDPQFATHLLVKPSDNHRRPRMRFSARRHAASHWERTTSFRCPKQSARATDCRRLQTSPVHHEDCVTVDMEKGRSARHAAARGLSDLTHILGHIRTAVATESRNRAGANES